jgi:flagellin-like hook-associated protein FlgL
MTQGQEYEKLASGKRITKSSDDAAGLGVAKKMEAEVRGYRQACKKCERWYFDDSGCRGWFK